MESREKARERSRLWYLANKERHKEYNKKYYSLNKERVREYQRKYRREHKDWYKNYYLANRERILQKQREWRISHFKVKKKLVPDNWITTQQVCQMLNVSRERVRQLRNEKRIPYLELSSHILIYPKGEIEKKRRMRDVKTSKIIS